jgi:hypothetical protein
MNKLCGERGQFVDNTGRGGGRANCSHAALFAPQLSPTLVCTQQPGLTGFFALSRNFPVLISYY